MPELITLATELEARCANDDGAVALLAKVKKRIGYLESELEDKADTESHLEEELDLANNHIEELEAELGVKEDAPDFFREIKDAFVSGNRDDLRERLMAFAQHLAVDLWIPGR